MKTLSFLRDLSLTLLSACNFVRSFNCILVCGVTTLALISGCASTVRSKGVAVGDEEKTATLYLYSTYERGIGVSVWGIIPLPEISNHATKVVGIDSDSHSGGDYFGHYSPEILVVNAKRARLGLPGIHDPLKVLIAPGHHSISLAYARERAFSICGYFGCGFGAPATSRFSAEFDAEPGHEYRALAYDPNPQEESEWIWIEDLTSGAIVYGEKPPALFTEDAKQ